MDISTDDMINVTCVAVGQGLGTACDTYYSQNFGSENKKNMGVVLQRAIWIFGMALAVCYAFQMNLETVLLLFGQDPRVAKLSGDYMLIFLPGCLLCGGWLYLSVFLSVLVLRLSQEQLPPWFNLKRHHKFFFLYIILSKYVQNQNLVLPNMFIGLISVTFNCTLHYVLLYKVGWGINGAALSQMLTYFLMLLLTIIYIRVSGIYKATWSGWTTECFQEWGPFAYLAVAGLLGICLEWWCFEVSVLLAGLLGVVELGAQSVLMQFDCVWFQIPFGFGTAVAIRVGNFVGAGFAEQAKTAAWVAMTSAVSISIIGIILWLSLSQQLPYIFTNVEEVASMASSVIPLMSLYMFFDCLSFVGKGVSYGTGQQTFSATATLCAYYLIALPIGVPLMFLTYLRLKGIWLGLSIAIILLSLVLFLMVAYTDWQKEVEKAQKRFANVDKYTTDPEQTGLLATKQKVYGAEERESLVGSMIVNSTEVQVSQQQPVTTDRPTTQSLALPFIVLLWRRTFTILIFSIILLMGILVKMFVVVIVESPNNNSTDFQNITTQTTNYFVEGTTEYTELK